MGRIFRAALYVTALVVVGAWFFLPGSNSLRVLRESLAGLWAFLQATRLGPYLPPMDLSLLGASLLTVTSAALYTRVVMIAWRSYAFVRRRKKAAIARAKAAPS